MKIWLYSELLEEVIQEVDMTNEDFITDDEWVGFYNDGLKMAESEILKINEDYFLNRAALSMVQGTAQINPPSDCFAMKMRGLVYKNGATIYPVTRIRGSKKFLDIEITNDQESSDDYRYTTINPSSAGFKIMLVPPPRETGSYLALWYIRNATRVPKVGEVISGVTTTEHIQDNTPVDVPEFAKFIKAVMKAKAKQKDNGGVIPPDAAAEVADEKKLMIETLTEMVPDDDNEIPPDMSHYSEHE